MSIETLCHNQLIKQSNGVIVSSAIYPKIMSNDVVTVELPGEKEFAKLVRDIMTNHSIFRERPGVALIILQYLEEKNKQNQNPNYSRKISSLTA